MMNHQDIELLESFLDGALDAPAAGCLQQRLEAEPELTSQLTRLQTDRNLRLQLWQSFEPAEIHPERTIAAIQARETHRAWYLRLLDHRDRFAAAAACIAVFLIGWQWGRNVNSYRMYPAGGGATQSVGLITQQQVPNGQAMVFEVRINDASGKLVRVERFGSLPEAQRFLEEIKSQMLAGKPR